MPDKQDITAVILAGGEARRMHGEDKGLIMLGNEPMVKYILGIMQPQVSNILINANRNIDDYAQYQYPVISDSLSGFCGPLAGIASAMEQTDTEYLVSAPCDSPFIPKDLVQRLAENIGANEIAVAHNGERIQPVFSLLNTSLLDSLQDYLNAGERKIDRWFNMHSYTEVDFSDHPHAFMNINTPAELEQAEALLSKTRV